MIDIEENQLKIAAFINRYKSDAASLMEKTYLEALEKLTIMIAETSSQSEKARRVALQKQIIDILDRGYNNLNPLLLDDMKTIAQYSYTNTMLAMASHGGAILAFTDLPDRVVKEILDMRSLIQLGESGVTIEDMVNSNKEADIKAFKQKIGSGIASGQTSEQIAKELKDVVKRREKQILTITRTVIAEASSRASMESYQQNDDVIIGWQYNATLDRRTTPHCAGNDGKQFLKSKGWTRLKLAQNNLICPCHYNCRSRLEALTKFSKDIKSKRGYDGMTTEQRKEANKLKGTERDKFLKRFQGDTSLTYEKWFDKQSAAFKSEWLGKKRYELYKRGKLSFVDMINGDGLKSIKELERMTAL
jgi:SPP1 gp7 family putative phage head morphogenesis protein